MFKQLQYIIVLACLLAAQTLYADDSQSKVYQGFSGGMMGHAGYLFGENADAPKTDNGLICSPQGGTFGLGGALRVHLWKHLRVGGEGFVSTMNSGTTNMKHVLQKGSYIRTGFGGVLMDACWRKEKVWPYIGGSVGGGAMRSLYVLDGNQDDWIAENKAYLHKQSFFYVNPYVGMDWCMTQKVHMTFRVDWMVALHAGEVVLPTGPRLLVGFMFCH
ncbi:MAG: hypothetical protein IKV31_01230 [Paludibacteraceae bacterium]|nr:hypothetical protein [Paludibacteraceae bacterium]